MKVGIITIAIVSLALSAARAVEIQMTEFEGSSSNFLRVTLDGHKFTSVIVTGPGTTDDFRIELIDGYKFNTAAPPAGLV
jgi:hypothetical protein